MQPLTMRACAVAVGALLALTACASGDTDGVNDAAGRSSASAGADGQTAAKRAKSAGIEVLPDRPGKVDRLPGLRRTDPDEPLLAGGRRGTRVAQGRYAVGYPKRLLPALPGSTIRSTSVSRAGKQAQVALTASPRRGQRVLRDYRVLLARLGFAETGVDRLGAQTSATFRRGSDSVTVGVVPGRSYSVLATLATGPGGP